MNVEEHSVIVELLDPERHDRDRFFCGVDPVDNYFRKTASKLAKAGNARVYVMTSLSGDVIGFYALNAHSVDFTELPSRYARTRPSHGESQPPSFP